MIRVLVDEDLPIRLRHYFGEEVSAETVEYRGWKGLKSGELLDAIAAGRALAHLVPALPALRRPPAGGPMMQREQIITSDPEIMGGTPVFTGTRIPVESLITHLKAGETLEEFLEGFPSVSREQAEAFLELALHAALQEHACPA